jgi:hypothetical protein
MCDEVYFRSPQPPNRRGRRNLAFVKLLETVAGPSETARFKGSERHAVDGNSENHSKPGDRGRAGTVGID